MQKRGGAWNAQERQNHINVLEMKASEIALQSPSKRRNKKPCSFENGQHDSGSICQKNWGRAQITHSNQSCQEHVSREITLTAEHLQGLQNQTTDMESRKIMETSTNNWKLNTQVFSLINKARCPIMSDLFAERLNAQVTHYIS